MAEVSRKVKENVPGPWFVDDACTMCGLCAMEDPDNFGMGDTSAYVKEQPSSPAEEAECESISKDCPAEAIGKE